MQIVYHHAHSSRRILLTHHALHPFPSRTQAIDGVGKTVFTLAISLSAVSFGAHLASLLRPLIPRPSLPPPSIAPHTATSDETAGGDADGGLDTQRRCATWPGG